MCIFEGMGIDFRFSASLILLFKLFLCSVARCFLSLLFRKLFSLQKSFLFLSLLKQSLFLSIQLLLLEVLLSSCGCFGTEILNFLFFFCHFNLSFLFFNHSVHLRLLHEANLGHQGPVADCCWHMSALGDSSSSDGRELRGGVLAVEDITFDTGLLHLSLRTSTARTAMSSWWPTWRAIPLLLRLFHVVLQGVLLSPVMHTTLGEDSCLAHWRVLGLDPKLGCTGTRVLTILHAEIAGGLSELGVSAHAVLGSIVIHLM